MSLISLSHRTTRQKDGEPGIVSALESRVNASNDDHKIGYDEFKAWWSAGEARWRQTEHTEEEMAKLAQATAYFDYFDKDKSGHISAEEFQLLHADLLKNGMLQETDARSSFEAMDKTGEGGIDFNEYVDWLHEKGVF